MGLICSIEKVIYYLIPSVTAMVQQFAKGSETLQSSSLCSEEFLQCHGFNVLIVDQNFILIFS